MAYPTGHTPPTGFVAGQLADGAVFGTFAIGTFGIPAQANCKAKVTLRYYKGLLIGMCQIGADDAITSVETIRVKSREFFNNLKSYPGISGNTAFANLVPMLATAAQLSAIGISDGSLTLDSATGAKIPFQQDADGQVTAYVDPNATQVALNNAITKLANGTTPTGAAAVAAGTTGTADASSINWKNVIMYTAIGIAVIVGGVFLMKTFKKKGGKPAGKK